MMMYYNQTISRKIPRMEDYIGDDSAFLLKKNVFLIMPNFFFSFISYILM